jgi:hypothetical protein
MFAEQALAKRLEEGRTHGSVVVGHRPPEGEVVVDEIGQR